MLARSVIACAVALLLAGPSPAAAAPSAKQAYDAAMARENALRATSSDEGPAVRPSTASGRRDLAEPPRPDSRDVPGANAKPAPATLKEARAIVVAYEGIVRRHPVSGYCDNALWQAGQLSADLFALSHDEADRQTAARLLAWLAREYPTSPFAARAAGQARRLQSAAPANAPTTANSAEASTRGREAPPNAVPARRSGPNPASTSIGAIAPPPAGRIGAAAAQADVNAAAPARTAAPLSTISGIRRTVLSEVIRVSIEMDREVLFHEERVEHPARLLFDLPATKAAAGLQDADWSYQDDVVRRIRVGRHPNQTTRVVLDLEGVSRYTVITLYNPYRILIDCERATAATLAAAPAAAANAWGTGATVPGTLEKVPRVKSPARNVPGAAENPPGSRKTASGAVKGAAAATGAGTTEAPPDAPARKDPAARAPAPPADKADGNRVSMARQLGLGVSRIVIDPGHGGHDPGAEGTGVSEAHIVLDIALRLEKALKRQPGVEVVLTRRTDVFVPLEERTQMANREQADLFLSIHANASHNPNARGIESYYLNFASNPDAEAVAARENAASERTMNSLTDIVRAIALNNKLDESKDLAALVQQAMARRLKPTNKSLKDLGVKQAPFVVLIGAAMPSVLAEVSFVTNRREGQLLGTDAYRQRIADALADAVLRYKRTLKSANLPATPDR